MSNKPLIIITGASSGFGAKTAEIFNQKWFPLLLIARRVEKIKQLPLNFENILIENIDVTQINELNAAIKKAESIYGPADLLVNNAGVMLLGNITEQDESEWQTMLQTNVIGVLNGMKAVLGNMTKKKSRNDY